MKSRPETSAGGVVYRQGEHGVEVIVGKDAGYKKWVLPKGLVRKSEEHAEAALREVEEETGVKPRLIGPIGEPEKYIYTARGVRVFKSVYYFLMAYEGESENERDREMAEVRWVPIDEAIDLVAYEGAKNVLRQAKEMLRESGEIEGR
ncbi:MAG TPA: NUDIX domain-containing protein [Aggregatilineales bacterium]|nr:NUDIX domain-containing protein [Aggregatilineales bacterium]